MGSEMKYADIAWDATLRAAALRHRVGEGGWTRPVITLEDIRTRRREKKNRQPDRLFRGCFRLNGGGQTYGGSEGRRAVSSYGRLPEAG